MPTLLKNLGTKKLLIIGIVPLVAVIGAYVFFTHHAPAYQFVTVQKGSITQTVSLTGNTTPSKNVSLSFGSSGIIASTNGSLGGHAYAGQVLASLNVSDIAAQVREAQANVDAQQAKLQSLQAGSRPEDIAAAQAGVDKAKQDLANMYAGIPDTSRDSYTKANDAVRVLLDPFFSNAETNPKLTYATSDSQAQHDAETGRLAAASTLSAWQQALGSQDLSPAGQESFVQRELSYLTSIRQLLENVSRTLDNAPGLSPSTIASYKASVSSALSEVNTASRNLNAISQNIASQKLVISQAQAQLSLKQAGSLPSDIAAQQAQIEQARAAVQSAQAKYQNSQIIAPISGVITQFDAKVGQLASPSTPLVSIISASGYEVDAGASETDIGKIMPRDRVTMTLDAFPRETFSGVVFYIAPSDTNTQGVINYQIKIAFNTPDPRLKSGLTTNAVIETNKKDNVLILPQYAVLQTDQGTFVEILQNNKVLQIPVVLGVQDQSGNVEIVSGVTQGEKVLNIGLKQQ